MTKTLVLYRGLSGLGKSTQAKEEKTTKTGCNPESLVPAPVVERDYFRRNGIKKESEITVQQREVIQSYFDTAHERVVVSDTNLNPRYFGELSKWAIDNGYEVEVKDFRGDTPVEALSLLYTSIKQDVGRKHAVGESVIRNQYFNFIAPNFHYTKQGGERVVIADMDGTLADIRHRSPYEEGDKILSDKPNYVLISILRHLQEAYRARVLVFSGRKEKTRVYTEQWLQEHVVDIDYSLHMRSDDDNRTDFVVKHEMFEEQVADKNRRVVSVFDDRVMMRDYWNTRGLPLFSLERGTIF